MRLRRQAELMPLLSEGKFIYVRDKLGEHMPKRWLLDEIDILDQTQLEVSLQLEKMQGQIIQDTHKLQNLALYDNLTGLANRHQLLKKIQHNLLLCKNNESIFSLLFLDLDNFKRINDSLGHTAGDNLLVIVSQRLRSCVRNRDMVARLGGDEFCILVENLHNKKGGEIVASNILNILKSPGQYHNGSW